MTYSSKSIKSGTYNIQIHQWINPKNKKWAMASHGYLDHCLYLKPILDKLIAKNYNILCYDLPGHGKSSGAPADIKDFNEYKSVFNDVLKELPKTSDLLFIGHSTGNVGFTQSLMEQSWQNPFKKIIMIAPLTRSYMWKAYQWALNKSVIGKVKWVPLLMRNDHPDYKALVKIDPYRVKRLPTNWLWQLSLWFEEINSSYVVKSRKMHVIFGKKDTVVDQEYGRLFYSKVFPNSTIINLEESHHMPYYDEEENIKIFDKKLDPLL